MPGTRALGIPPERKVTVLATSEGEFVILDQDALERGEIKDQGINFLLGESLGPAGDSIGRDRIPDLLDVPLPVSPSGP
jgi:hypothetical protein